MRRDSSTYYILHTKAFTKDINQLNNNMIPIKDKKYMINCQGPYDYNRYMGDGVFTGEVTDFGDETCYGFIIPTKKEACFFVEEEIVAYFTDNNHVRSLICDPDNYPKDSNYCETCGSCGC